MRYFLLDAYRKDNKIVLWLKTPEENIRLERDFSISIYADKQISKNLDKHNIFYKQVKRKNYLRRIKEVLEIPIPNLSGFEKFVRDLERETKHRIPLYNADIAPEQMFLYENDLKPCSAIELREDKIIPLHTERLIELTKMKLMVVPSGDIRLDADKEIKLIKVDDKILEGEEREVLAKFAEIFSATDPDVIMMDYAYSRLPYLAGRLEKYGIVCDLHRWDAVPLKYRGGRSYWSYGQVRYQDYSIKLHGRFLVDNNSFVGTECEPEAIMELSELSGSLFQAVAARSFGAVFQSALVREMVMQDILVPFKEKPIEPPLTMLDMLKSDRAGHTLDPKVGFHKDVAEIDFTSMFPWLIYNHNISVDCILAKDGPFVSVPNTRIKTSMAYKGLVPTAVKPFIDRRMYYKKNPSTVNKKRAKGLKWVLVSCYGYLRFREFKLGVPSAHMAICAFARETLLEICHLAEERGFEVVHGIVDSLYIKKKGITKKEVQNFCQEIEMIIGIPISFEGIFKWIVFLPSVIDKDRPLPSTYYGAFYNGDIKARGIELRRRNTPMIVKIFQENCISILKKAENKKEFLLCIPEICRYYRQLIEIMPSLDKKYFLISLRIAKRDYVNDIPQKLVLKKLQDRNISLMPGQFISFYHSKKGVSLPEEEDIIDHYEYKRLLERSLFTILQPFIKDRFELLESLENERQMRIEEFMRKKVITINSLIE